MFEQQRIAPALVDAAWWPAFARRIAAWLDTRELRAGDVVVLLPFAQHLPLARQAWAGLGRPWMPRFETTQTLARSLAPAPQAGAGELSFDAATDRLTAIGWLRKQGWAPRDPRGLEQAAARVVELAHGLARCAADIAPQDRAAYFEQARALLSPSSGPGAQEKALARLALEWAALSSAASSDALFEHRPAAWIALLAGGADELVLRLLERAAAAGQPCLQLDADPPQDVPFAGLPAPGLRVCSDFEHEAQCTAAEVLARLSEIKEEGAQVALIALDRVLVRRVRALLECRGISLADETGWKLSTTRAAAAVMSLLRAARSRASGDELLDWLKSGDLAWPGPDAAVPLEQRIDALERAMRRQGWVRAWDASIGSAVAEADPGAAELWQQAQQALAPLRALPRSTSLIEALRHLRDALHACGAWEALSADAAGRVVIEALNLDVEAVPGSAWQTSAAQARVDLDGLIAWADAALEQVSFRPPAEEARAQVVITPLARALLRPFAAIVLPGCDESHLGVAPTPLPLIGDALATQLGLPGVAAQRARELAAFALLLRVPVVSLLRRESDSESALAPSPLLERLLLSRRREQREAAVLPERRIPRRLALEPVARPLPRLGRPPELLPRQLSATACEALRACPYRFHALVGLGLREADELDDAIEKRDVGTWLHAVLQRFHVERGAMNDAVADEAQLQAVADSVREEMGLLQADFLPHALWFQQLIPGYVAWLHKDEAAGAHFREGEVELKAQPEELAGVGVSLRGRIDRLDGVYESGGHALRIVDYKASRPNDWRKRVKQPLEDTQLAFYAALLQTARAEPPAGLHAAYLALEGDKPSLVEHAQVGASAQQLLLGLADELGRIAAGEPLPALGEEPACTYCEARGLCRRDHWADAS